MRIYVDELPKSCDDCEFGYFYDCQYCTLRPDLMRKDEWCEKEKDCPLQSLTDYTKQVRKEEKIKINRLVRNWLIKEGFTAYEFDELFEEIRGTENE